MPEVLEAVSDALEPPEFPEVTVLEVLEEAPGALGDLLEGL